MEAVVAVVLALPVGLTLGTVLLFVAGYGRG